MPCGPKVLLPWDEIEDEDEFERSVSAGRRMGVSAWGGGQTRSSVSEGSSLCGAWRAMRGKGWSLRVHAMRAKSALAVGRNRGRGRVREKRVGGSADGRVGVGRRPNALKRKRRLQPLRCVAGHERKRLEPSRTCHAGQKCSCRGTKSRTRTSSREACRRVGGWACRRGAEAKRAQA